MIITLTDALIFAAIVIAILISVPIFLGTRIKKRWDATSMYNIAACLVVASIITGTMSLIAVWVALPNSDKINFSHQDVVVDIFSVLVTVLMGWNIISVVDIKKKAESIDHITADLEKVISGIIQMAIHSFVVREDKEAVINSCFVSLEKILECSNELVRGSATREIMKVLYQVKKSYKTGEKVYIYKGCKEKYKSILWQLDDEYKSDIIKMIENADQLNSSGENIAFASNGQMSGISSVGVTDVYNQPNN